MFVSFIDYKSQVTNLANQRLNAPLPLDSDSNSIAKLYQTSEPPTPDIINFVKQKIIDLIYFYDLKAA